MNNFDLEGAIAQWRKRLSWRDAFTDADLDEMESHLRDEVESLVTSGQNEQEAFYQTVQAFGEDMKLAWRYNQANWETVMIKRTKYAPTLIHNYFKVAIRNLLKHKIYSAINIAGLAIGIACSVLILLFVQHELSYDRFHENADRIYRVALEWRYNTGEVKHMALTSPKLAPTLKNDVPGVEQAARISKTNLYLQYQNAGFQETNINFADAEILQMFSFTLLRGNPETALSKPFSIVLTETTAQKYFGDRDPIGKVLTVKDTLNLTVTGILAPIPDNSHMTFDALISYVSLPIITGYDPESTWGAHMAYNYILLHKSVSPADVAPQIYDITRQHIPTIEDRLGMQFKHFLQPLTDIHLHSSLKYEFSPTSSIIVIYVFSSIAVFILLIACVNFMNLATARSMNRAREVGMRKIVGALHKQLILQFLGESILFAFMALLLAIGLIELALPSFNALAGKNLNLFYYTFTGLNLIGLTFVVGVVSGIYPAFAVSRFKPIDILKGSGQPNQKGHWLRKGLITFQFVTSVILLISTGVIHNQLNYMRTKKLGFDKKQVVIISYGQNVQKQYELLKAEFLKHPQVLTTSAAAYIPGRIIGDTNIKVEGQGRVFFYNSIDHDYVETFGLELVAGRGLSASFPTDKTEAFILNETAVAYLGWGSPEEAIGKEAPLAPHDNMGRLIGVVKDFHYASLQQPVKPLLMYYRPDWFSHFEVKIGSEHVSETLLDLKNIWHQIVPNRPFDYFFLDEDYDRQYRSEERLADVFTAFSTLSICIACLGLLGLISFSTQQRTKEIGVRKVLGASVQNILVLLTRDFVKLILLSNLIAWPVAYFAMNHWLQDFAYRTNMGIGTFVFSGSAALLIALLTIAYQAVKAACANPVDVLHYE